VDRDPGVGHEDVEAPHLLDDLVDGRLGRLRVGHVEAADLGLAALGDDRVGDLLGGGLALDVVDDDRRALPRERLGARAPDAARAAGDESYFSIEPEHDFSPSSIYAARNARTLSRAAASPTLRTLISFAQRLARPARTLPGPISSAWVTPRSFMSTIACSQ